MVWVKLVPTVGGPISRTLASVMGCTRHVLTERCPKRSPRARLRLCGLCCCTVPTGSAGLLAEPQPRQNRWSQAIGGKGIRCPRALGAGVGRSRGSANPSLPLPLPQPGPRLWLSRQQAAPAWCLPQPGLWSEGFSRRTEAPPAAGRAPPSWPPPCRSPGRGRSWAFCPSPSFREDRRPSPLPRLAASTQPWACSPS